MDGDSITHIIIIILMICLSAFFSSTETAFSSLSRSRLKTLSQDGDKKAKQTYKLSENYDDLLSTILIGNNIVNIVAATLSTIVFMKFFPKNGAIISTLAITVLVLIFGEITPKSIAKQSPEKFAMTVSPVLKVLVAFFKPFNFLLLAIKSGISKLVGVQDSSGITESELLTLVDEAEQDGGINETESELIKNAIEFNDLEAIDIFTPRIDVCAINKDTTINEIANIFRETGYSRLPVYNDTIDRIIGVINEKDFHNYIVGTQKPISHIMKAVEFIPPSIKISELLRTLQRKKQHLAVIVDEYGGTEGIVTLEDILEELVGEIWDEHDEVVAEICDLGDGNFIVPTENELDDFFERFEITQETEASSINGWVVDNIDKIPAVGDSFDLDNLTVSVTKIGNKTATEINVKINFPKQIVEEE
ncbi:MAG: hemolysin family protein [Clostridia bacterium]